MALDKGGGETGEQPRQIATSRVPVLSRHGTLRQRMRRIDPCDMRSGTLGEHPDYIAPEFANGFIPDEVEMGVYYRSKVEFLEEALWLPATATKHQERSLKNLDPPLARWADAAKLYVDARTKSEATYAVLGKLSWERWITTDLGLDPVKVTAAFKHLPKTIESRTRIERPNNHSISNIIMRVQSPRKMVFGVAGNGTVTVVCTKHCREISRRENSAVNCHEYHH